MTHGIYSSGSAMVLLELRQEVTANNLANAATTGFRRDLVAARDPGEGESGMRFGPLSLPILDTRPALETGPILQTGNPGDLAISGDGFFVVQGEGGEFLTRAGAFQRDPNGYLANERAERLLGQAGPIRVDSDDFHVARGGEVVVAGAAVDTLRIEIPSPDATLRKAGEGHYERPPATSPARPGETAVFQGYIEKSNVNAIREMISLITAFRAYEANSKSIQTEDHVLDKAVNEVGRVA